ncbi:UDP-N-acetylmuramoyl-tripeptide--D-alanyl-D-alanine ligase [Paraferrimonas sp. SM1919]|uniref:UDP-N-acetylmuramoyl-tripeptide--D-alanyl-D- alanine ligase n=1 Tax=Paraferrimonas sp. SM1919 TaxID=2662263 RepID=UPI0013D781E5|nr:UDP-N-acetylmuramoyl-tripeptide--D-alanyl-D-alanine ligase [Paraferrimonas sp. SM1919]
MIPLTLQQIAAYLGGRLVGEDATITNVSTDSKNVTKDTLFIALIGERFDAHQFVAQALECATAAVVSQAIETNKSYILVDDTKRALGLLGKLVISQLSLFKFAITGSCGKTTVKEMLNSIMSNEHNTLATAGNFNNDIGAPLTMLRFGPEQQVGIFELGANHQHEIDYTSGLVEPDVALVNNIGAAHIEGFGSLQGVAQAKSEIYKHLGSQGVAVLNADDAFYPFLKQQASHCRNLSFGLSASAQVRAQNLQADELARYQFELCYGEQRQPVKLQLNGKHQVLNALAAAAMAIAADVSLEVIAKGLQALQAVSGRLLPHYFGGKTVIDDTYNANPTSVNAAIDVLAQSSVSMLILGDFAELGDTTEAGHRQVGAYAKQQGIDFVLTLGSVSKYTSIMADGVHFEQLPALLNYLSDFLSKQPQLTILVKGSRGARMERVISALKQQYQNGEWR